MNQGMKRTLISLAYSDLAQWPAPDISVLDKVDQNLYHGRRQAVEMYASGESYLQIRVATGKSEDEVQRLVKRCVTLSDDGFIFGFYALLRGARLKSYVREAVVSHQKGNGSAGCAGALEQLFELYPDVRELVHELYLKESSHRRVHEARSPIYSIHNSFKKILRELGLTDNDWPFNTENCGYQAICSYCRKLREAHLGRGMLARSGIDASRRGAIGQGHRPVIPNLRAYSFVQLDFHKVDAASIIILRNDYGVELEVPISRWHIGFLVEERYGAITGAYVALERTPSGDSTLEVIESALRIEKFEPEDPRCTLLNDGKALIIQLLPELTFQCFSALKVDNGWANAAHEVVNNIIDTIGCAVNFGPTYGWWRRSLIEKIFGELTQRGLQRLPSTHGTGPTDTRVNNPNLQAIKFRILLSELISVIYGCIRKHNVERTERLQWTSPLEGIQAALCHPGSGFFHQPLPLAVQGNLRLMMHIEEVTVRGNLKKNERPYFVLDRCRYTNENLANAYWLIGKKIVTYTDRRKCRIVSATVKDTGEHLGLMTPSGRWANSDCSWRDRKLINRSGMADYCASDTGDPVQDWADRKAKELFSRRKPKQKQSSADALQLARFINQNKKAPKEPAQSTSVASRNVNAVQVGRQDPFGLNDVPKMKPTTRRT